MYVMSSYFESISEKDNLYGKCCRAVEIKRKP